MKSKFLSTLLAAAVLTACAANPAPRRAAAPAEPAAPASSLAKVYFYPQRDQAVAQQDRDRYECNYWSVRETGFDPTRRIAPPEVRATVIPARSPGHMHGAGADVGTMLDAIATAEDVEPRRVERAAGGEGRYAREAAEFRRAMSACLEGRGYLVK